MRLLTVTLPGDDADDYHVASGRVNAPAGASGGDTAYHKGFDLSEVGAWGLPLDGELLMTPMSLEQEGEGEVETGASLGKVGICFGFVFGL